MIGIWDDLALHQTPATLDQPASSDPAVYERYYFGSGDIDGEWSVGCVVDVNPNKGVLDAAFSVSNGHRHESVYAADVLGGERDDLRCGPIRLTIEEPMRTLRLRVDHADVSADIRFHATSPALQEDRVTRYRANRVVQDRSRYVQLGTVSGSVRSPLGELEATEVRWRAGRDHSWGIWDAPKEHADDDVAHSAPSFFWLIGAFDDEAVQVVTHTDSGGRPYGEYGACAPTLAVGAALAGAAARQRPLRLAGVDIEYQPGTRRVATADIRVGDAGAEGTIRLENLHAILPRSVGYAHPGWVQGTVYPDLPHVERESFDVDALDLQAPLNRRALQIVRLTRANGDVGYGVIDQAVAAA